MSLAAALVVLIARVESHGKREIPFSRSVFKG